jgi:hypothetical protein
MCAPTTGSSSNNTCDPSAKSDECKLVAYLAKQQEQYSPCLLVMQGIWFIGAIFAIYGAVTFNVKLVYPNLFWQPVCLFVAVVIIAIVLRQLNELNAEQGIMTFFCFQLVGATVVVVALSHTEYSLIKSGITAENYREHKHCCWNQPLNTEVQYSKANAVAVVVAVATPSTQEE